jgi:hypothetical protein
MAIYDGLLIFIAWLDINGFLVGFDGDLLREPWSFNRVREYSFKTLEYLNTVRNSKLNETIRVFMNTLGEYSYLNT